MQTGLESLKRLVIWQLKARKKKIFCTIQTMKCFFSAFREEREYQVQSQHGFHGVRVRGEMPLIRRKVLLNSNREDHRKPTTL